MRGLTTAQRAARERQQQEQLDHFFYDLFRQGADHLRAGRGEDARSVVREAELRARSTADRAQRTIVRTARPTPAPYFDTLALAAFVVLDYENLRESPGRPWPRRITMGIAPASAGDLALVLADRLGIAVLHRDRPTLARFAVSLVFSTRDAATAVECDTARALALTAWGLADGFGDTSTTSAQVAVAFRPLPPQPATAAGHSPVALHVVRSR